MLNHLLAANLFVVPLDQQGRWYRYHHQFGAFLRARLASSGTANLRAAHERACRALEDRGDDIGALQQAMAMPDADRAGRIVRAALGRSTSRPDGTDLTVQAIRLWLHEFGAAMIETDPAWVVELLIELMTLSDADDGPAWLERVRRAHPRADGELTALIEMARAEHHQQRGQPLQAISRLVRREAIGDVRPTEARSHTSTLRSQPHTSRPVKLRPKRWRQSSEHSPTRSAVPSSTRFMVRYRRARCGRRRRAHPRRAARQAPHDAADELGLDAHEPERTFADLELVEVHLERHDHEIAARILHQLTQAGDAGRRPMLRSLITLDQASWRACSATRSAPKRCSVRPGAASPSPTRPSARCSARRPLLRRCASIRQQRRR